jgi:hypothetical protein
MDGWGASAPNATGTDHVNDCTPSCAQGNIDATPVLINLYNPEPHNGRMMYLCYLVTFTAESQRPPLGNCE